MGKEFINYDKFTPKPCKHCGSKSIRVRGERTIEYEEVILVGSYETVDYTPIGVNRDVIYEVVCAECDNDLSEEYDLL